MVSTKNIFATFALLGTLWAVVATSSPQKSVANGSFKVTSDCVTPVKEANVNVANGMVINGGATSFTDFGFPQAVVNGAEVVGTVGIAQRICTPTYTDTDQQAYVYSCYDNGVPTCTITIQ